MNRELLIEYTPDLIRAALLEDGKLCEIHRERVRGKKQTDSLYLGRVKAIRPSVGAAFVDIGESLHAFLPIQESCTYKCGDDIIVQGTAVQAVETKGLRISDKINIAGKWLVLVPGGQGVRISKKIKDPALRAALMEMMEPLCPEGCGFIIRTASSDISEDALAEEADALLKQWTQIQNKAHGMTRPGVIHEPADLVETLVRDIGGTLSRVITNNRDTLARLQSYYDRKWLNSSATIEYFGEDTCLMNDVYSFDVQVDKALKKRIWLDCGGYIVFDFCEALTVVDVNSGKMVLGRDAEDTALRVNLEAAEEIARQIRLRDIGGIVIVDYIDMKSENNREQLLKKIREESLKDRSCVTLHGMTKLGLVEMARKRKGEQLSKALQTSCRICDGSGCFLSSEETAFRALRQVRRLIIAGQQGPFLIRCDAHTAALLGEMKQPDMDHQVYVVSDGAKNHVRYEINQIDIGASLPKGAMQLKRVKDR